MPQYYTYLISSLPYLRFGSKPPLSFQKFLQTVQDLISARDLAILNQVSISGDYNYTETICPVLKKWQDFDTCLRNELVAIRLARRHLNPQQYQRQQPEIDPLIRHIAATAYRNPSLLQAEMALDEQRWLALETFAFGHYFDLDILVIYALKLLILERWDKIYSADPLGRLEETLAQN